MTFLRNSCKFQEYSAQINSEEFQKASYHSQGLSIGVANKIFLEFPHQWWPKDSAGFSLLWSKADKDELMKTKGKVRGIIYKKINFSYEVPSCKVPI